MPSTYTPIATQTLGSNTTSVTFSSIASTYTDLILVMSIRSTLAANEDYALTTFNGDTGSNYSYTYMYGNGTSAASARSSNTSFISDATFAAASITSGVFTPVIVNFQNYSNTTTYKTSISRASSTATNGWVSTAVGLWRSTSAINSINIKCFGSGAQLATGSTFTLYGVKSA